MFFVIIGTVIGIVLGALALLAVRRGSTLIGWLVLGFGLTALIAVLPSLIAVIRPIEPAINPVFSIVAGVACLVSGIGAVTRGIRLWQIWVGLALGVVPILFWLAFGVGELLFPH